MAVLNQEIRRSKEDPKYWEVRCSWCGDWLPITSESLFSEKQKIRLACKRFYLAWEEIVGAWVWGSENDHAWLPSRQDEEEEAA